LLGTTFNPASPSLRRAPSVKRSDLAYLKSSEEPVIVLAVEATMPPDHPEQKIEVRRPIIGQDGTRYEYAEFFRFELETPEEQDLRKIEDIKRRHRLTQAAQKAVGPEQLSFDMAAPVDPNAPRN
jgi:hypothetical protein